MEPGNEKVVADLGILLGIIGSWVLIGFLLSLLPLARSIVLAVWGIYVLGTVLVLLPRINKRLARRRLARSDARTR